MFNNLQTNYATINTFIYIKQILIVSKTKFNTEKSLNFVGP